MRQAALKNYIIALLVLAILALGLVVTVLGQQNKNLKSQLDGLNKQLSQQQRITEKVQDSTDQIISYLRCVSLLPVSQRTPEIIDTCLTTDSGPIMPQKTSSSSRPAATHPTSPSPAPKVSQTTPPKSNDTKTTTNSGAGANNTAAEQQPGLVRRILNRLGYKEQSWHDYHSKTLVTHKAATTWPPTLTRLSLSG